MVKLFRGLSLALLISAIHLPVAHAQPITLIVAEDYESGYDRKLFKHWIDADADGCNTRLEVLIEEAIKKPKIGKNCILTSGTWKSPYDEKVYSNPSKLDIDHLVPLAEAWRSGAWKWTAQERQNFANDLDEPVALVAVSLNLNRSKGDRDLSQWSPPKGKCSYLKSWIVVKSKYSLTIDREESKAISTLSKECLIEVALVDSSSSSAQVTPTPTSSLDATSNPSTSVSPSPLLSPSNTPSSPTRIVSPGAFCSQSEAGTQGKSAKGITYTCKISDSENRLRWRQ